MLYKQNDKATILKGIVVAIANQNGGVGKTTTAMNLGAALYELGESVLLVDLDPQGTLTIAHGFDPESLSSTIYTAFVNRDFDTREAILHSENGSHLIPANIDLSAAEVELLSELGRENYLKETLETLKGSYSFILVDCPPSLGLLTINALVAADAVIIPVVTQYLRFRGMKLLLDTIERVKAKLNPGLLAPRILPTMFQSRTIHSREVLEEIRNTFGPQVFRTVVRHTIRLAEAPIGGQSILKFDSTSPHAEGYRQLAKEVKTWLSGNQ
jgi:chromosome partitioning protein